MATRSAKSASRSSLPEEPGVDPYRPSTWLNAVQAAAVCQVSKPTLLRWASRGEFCPAARRLPGGQWRVRYGDLVAWLENLPAE